MHKSYLIAVFLFLTVTTTKCAPSQGLLPSQLDPIKLNQDAESNQGSNNNGYSKYAAPSPNIGSGVQGPKRMGYPTTQYYERSKRLTGSSITPPLIHVLTPGTQHHGPATSVVKFEKGVPKTHHAPTAPEI